jgi:glyoxylase-like metal-dependent hydrolase (beta-lactamase superfamily II)
MLGPTEVAPGVYALGSELINWYVVADDGRLTAIDAGLPGFAGPLDADLRAIGHQLADVDAVVLTHSDSDHTGIAPHLKEAAGARVLIHEADEPALRKPGPKGGDASPRHLLPNLWRPFAVKILAHSIRHGAKPARVDGAETFRDGDVLDVPGRPRVVHTPGHTPGHCALLLEDRGVLFAGDALIAHRLITGGDGLGVMPRFFNTDNAQMRASLATIERLDAGVVLFGHGDPWRDGTKAAVASARATAAG